MFVNRNLVISSNMLKPRDVKNYWCDDWPPRSKRCRITQYAIVHIMSAFLLLYFNLYTVSIHLQSQNAELKASQAPTLATLRSVLLDPAVNILFQKLKAELQSTKARLEDTQNELSAWKFTPDSNTGKRLMAKCRLLYQENEELGKMTSNGRLAKLEGDLALQKSFSEEVKKSQSGKRGTQP